MADKNNGNGVAKRPRVAVVAPLSIPRYDEVFDDIQRDIQRLRDGKESENNARIIAKQRSNQLKFIEAVIQYARLTRAIPQQVE